MGRVYRATANAWRRREAAFRKAAGECRRLACPLPCLEDHGCCAKHREEENTWSRNYLRRKRAKK